MRKTLVVNSLAAFLLLFCALPMARSQEENKSSETAKAERPKTLHAYRVEFLITELDSGKKVNGRHYSMALNSGDRNKVKIGTRVPVTTGQGPTMFQYLDVGANIDCHLIESGDDLSLEVSSDFSSLSSAEEQHSPQPILHNISIRGSTLAALGKTVLIGTADDPNSNRQFQLEASVTRLK